MPETATPLADFNTGERCHWHPDRPAILAIPEEGGTVLCCDECAGDDGADPTIPDAWRLA